MATILTQLQEQEAAVKKRLADETKKLRAIQAKQRAEQLRLRRMQWQVAGRCVEEAGLPLDPDTLKPLLQAMTGALPAHRGNGSNGSLHADLCGISVPAPEDPDLPGAFRHPLQSGRERKSDTSNVPFDPQGTL